jgi:hypothetical protein
MGGQQGDEKLSSNRRSNRQDAKNTKRIIEICANQPLKMFWRTWRLGGFLFSAS